MELSKIRVDRIAAPSVRPQASPSFRESPNDPLSKQEVEFLLNKIGNLKDYTFLLFGFTLVYESDSYALIIVRSDGEGFANVWDQKKGRYRKIYVPETVLNCLKRYWNVPEDTKSPKFFDMPSKTVERIIQRRTTDILKKSKSWHYVRHT